MLILELEDLISQLFVVTHLVQVLVVGLRKVRGDLIVLRHHVSEALLPSFGLAVLLAE